MISLPLELDLDQAAAGVAEKLPLHCLRPWMVDFLKSIDGPVGVACSGGPDSLLLLLLLYGHFPQWRHQLHVLHYNHKQRSASDDEAYFVQDVVARLDLHYHYEELTDSGDKKLNEEVLRNCRHAFFKKTLSAHHIKYLALGHHADDLAETFLMRIPRGASSEGLAAPRPIHQQGDVTYFRPLLSFPKGTLQANLEMHHVPFAVDPSNAEGNNLRAWVRKLVPKWKGAYPTDFITGLLRTRRHLEEDADALNAYMREKIDPDTEVLPYATIQELPAALTRRALLQWLNFHRQPFTAQVFDILRIKLDQGAPFVLTLSATHELRYDGQQLVIAEKKSP